MKLAKLSIKSQKEGASALSEKITKLVHWVKTGKRPTGLTKTELAKLKLICENLIAKKYFTPSAREVFQT